MIKSSFPLIILIVFAAISVVALHGIARNLAQKRDFYSDPLCKVFWEKYQARRKASHANNPEKSGEYPQHHFSEKRRPHRITTEYPSTKTATLATGNSAFTIFPQLSRSRKAGADNFYSDTAIEEGFFAAQYS